MTERQRASRSACRPWSLLVVLEAVVALGYSRPDWARRTGIESADCSGCHGGGATPTVTLSASPLNPTVGQAVTLTVTVSQANGPVAGFFLTTVDPLLRTADPVGTWVALEPGTSADSGGVVHNMPRTGSGGITTFRTGWSSKVATGVTFLANGMSANGDNTPRGDAPGTATLSLSVGCAGIPYYVDQDGDGYGTSDPAFLVPRACTQPAGYAMLAGDCDDFAAAIHPGAPELCDGKDNNCDGHIDENVVYLQYCEDKDGDGHGIPGRATKTDCKPSLGFGDCNGDCNDFDNTIHPGAAEIHDGRDNNCDGVIDEDVAEAGTGARSGTDAGTPAGPMTMAGTGGVSGAGGSSARAPAGACAVAGPTGVTDGGVGATLALLVTLLIQRKPRHRQRHDASTKRPGSLRGFLSSLCSRCSRCRPG